MKSSHHPRVCRLQFENLEPREMMALTASLNLSGVLNVTGTSAADQAYFRQSSGRIYISGFQGSWSASKVKSIVIDLKGGTDLVSLKSLANGGTQALAENVTVRSGAGSETVRLANGHDVVMTDAGHTLTVSSTGVATLDGQRLTWNDSSSNWFTSNIHDEALRTLGSSLYSDGRIDRSDVISLLRSAENGGVVSSTELADLRAIAANTTLFAGAEYVWKLSGYIVNGNVANANYQGGALGNLAANSTGTQLEKLIGKWFLGLDHPIAGGTYRQVSGTLFVNGASYGDIKQGYLGDCYFMASLAETALRNPSAVNNMFVVNGDGTYTVRFYNSGRAEYVTVDSYLPTNSGGYLIYANLGAYFGNSNNELWTALAEKAYVQINEMGWLRGGLSGTGQNAYYAIEGGYIYAALGQITGQGTVAFTSTSGSTSFTTFVNAFNQGKLMGFASKYSPASSSVVGGHAYAVVGYDSTNQTVTLFNPWGTAYGLLTLTWSEVQANFSYFDRTA